MINLGVILRHIGSEGRFTVSMTTKVIYNRSVKCFVVEIEYNL